MVIRLRAIEVLAATIARLVPELDGRICAGPSEVGHKLAFPHLVILPIRFTFNPDQDDEIWQDVGNTRAVFQVGHHEALIQIRLGARTARQRAELEHAVSQVFISQRGRPGILLVQIPDCWSATVAYELDETEWENELAFDREWYSIMTLNAYVPALVERGGAYTIDEIRSSFTEDMQTSFAELPASAVEAIAVDENGNITASSPTP